MSENSQDMYNLIHKSECSMMLYTQPVTETRTLSEKLTELEEEYLPELLEVGRGLNRLVFLVEKVEDIK